MTRPAETLTLLADADRRHFLWAEDPAVRKITGALEAAAPGSARFVGGCVRDSLIGASPKDIDIATTLKPKEIIRALNRAGLRAAPTGIEHGTVTGIADGRGVEITTLRADLATDGRRATVAFTCDWSIDAARRDFRLNAIYLSTDYRLFDPEGGVADARAGRVRFIGSPEDRIREDYLRILRFFRFSARFAAAFDAGGLAACAALKDGIAQLSAERVGDEFSKILELPRAALAVEAMAENAILQEIWPALPMLAALEKLKSFAAYAPAPVALAALWGAADATLDERLRLSKATAARRRNAAEAAKRVVVSLSEKQARALLYRLGPETWADAMLIARAQSDDSADQCWDVLQELSTQWTPPRFPFTGKHVVAEGVVRGPAVSRILQAAEEAWIEEDFPPQTRAHEILKETIAKPV